MTHCYIRDKTQQQFFRSVVFLLYAKTVGGKDYEAEIGCVGLSNKTNSAVMLRVSNKNEGAPQFYNYSKVSLNKF